MELSHSRPQDSNGGRHLYYCLGLWLQLGRHAELRDVLSQRGLRIHRDYRLSFPFSHREALGNGYFDHSAKASLRANLSFRDRRQATLFKLSWDECPEGRWHPGPRRHSKIVLPIIRRVMPTVIASNIIGVSPMTGPICAIHAMRAKYVDSPPQAEPSSPLEENT